MFFAQTKKLRFIVSFTTALLWLHVDINLSEAQGESPVLGGLKLEGKSIERLTLQRQDNKEREEFRRPEQITKLPIGKYYLHEIHLEGGYICYAYRGPKRIQVNVTSDETAILKIGAPLKQIIKVNRQGRNLVMNYELSGAGGEKYISGNRGEKPAFTVYRGDKEIASENFEYG